MLTLMLPYYIVLFTGTIITLSSSSWFAAWMGLEINLLAFIPLLYSFNKLATEAIIKYFLIQAMASSFILFFSLILLMNLPSAILSIFQMINIMTLNIALLTKMGVAPFHFWFPSISEGLSWKALMVLMTWQKMAPLSLLVLNYNNLPLITFAVLSSMTGAIGGLNQTSTKKIMVYSSIAHMGWMIILITLSYLNTMVYFIFYSILSLSIMIFFNKFNMKYITQMFSLGMTNILLFPCILLFLSLGGLPPLMGFMPKWMALTSLMNYNFPILSLILVTMSILSLYYYLRISYSILLVSQTNNKMMLYFKTPMLIFISIIPTILILPLVMLLL